MRWLRKRWGSFFHVSPEPERTATRIVPKENLALYKMDRRPYCKVVQKELTRLGIAIEERETGRGSEWRAELQSITGRTQVPCLCIDGEPMFESMDIIHWLRKQYESRWFYEEGRGQEG